jgi:hypothetical protein
LNCLERLPILPADTEGNLSKGRVSPDGLLNGSLGASGIYLPQLPHVLAESISRAALVGKHGAEE